MNTRTSVLLSALLLVGLTACDKDDLDGQPSWLGDSIYKSLQSAGDYSYTLRIIDDLGYADVMAKTGSKTLFAASDSAWRAFFASNAWGVDSYERLTLAQKKLLLNSSMINNAYLIELLSNVEGSSELVEGMCMRRPSAVSIYDSVPRIEPSAMPRTRYWDALRGKTAGVPILKNDAAAPMIHFLPKFMQMNNFTADDMRILTNGESSSTADVWINGKKVVARDGTCKNGYIHRVDGVMLSSDNMAEIVRCHGVMSQWSELLDRYCAPYYSKEASAEYNRLYNRQDSVYVLRYFSSQKNKELEETPDRETVGAKLSFDPGRNDYMMTNTAGKDLHYNCGALLVPSNTALAYWWNNDGAALRDQYHCWDSVPDEVLVELINVNLVPDFVSTIPSKFANITNDAKVSMGVETKDVDSCFMGCNGVVYLTNKVFAPATYSSVAFPALVHTETMNIIYWGIDKLGFKPYLNSMDSYYSFILPTNDALLTYLDPCSFGSSTTVLYEFYYDREKKIVGAHRFAYDVELGQKLEEPVLQDASASQISNRLTDIIDNLIVVGNVEDGNTYYRTKAGSTIRVQNAGAQGVMTVEGGLQIDHNAGVLVSTIYDQTRDGNGKAYVVEGGLPEGGSKSVYRTLGEHPEYSRFFDLISGGDPDSAQYNLMVSTLENKYSCVDFNIGLFDNYNYTVWVPTNESLDALHTAGILPYWEDLEAQTDSAWGGNRDAAKVMKYRIRQRIMDFLRYHIQDYSLYIGQGAEEGRFETSKLNKQSKKFYALQVASDNNNITVTDVLGNRRRVQKLDGLYNNMCREYLFTAKDKEKGADGNIYNSSHAVVHLIDGPLFFSATQLEPFDWTPQAGQ